VLPVALTPFHQSLPWTSGIPNPCWLLFVCLIDLNELGKIPLSSKPAGEGVWISPPTPPKKVVPMIELAPPVILLEDPLNLQEDGQNQPIRSHSSGPRKEERVSEPLWTVKQLARYLGRSTSWVRYQILRASKEKGSIPFVRLPGNGAPRFIPNQIRRWTEMGFPPAEALHNQATGKNTSTSPLDFRPGSRPHVSRDG
jgi:hypothetical protein